MVTDMTLLARESAELMPSREALALVDIDIDTIIQVPLNIAIALFGANVAALQNVVANA